MSSERVEHLGGCPCGRVRFVVEASARIETTQCHCSICSQCGYLHLIVPKSRFQLIQGSEFLSCYQFNTGVARHLFCKVCGVKSYYVPRSNPDGYSVNVRCLDAGTIENVKIAQLVIDHADFSVEPLSGVSKGGEPPLWSRPGQYPGREVASFI